MFFRTSACLLICLASASLSNAATISVAPTGNARFRSIQAAIAAAKPGDTIRVAEGVHRGNITIDKPLTLRGSGPLKTIVELPGDTPPTIEAHWEQVIRRIETLTLEELKSSGNLFKQTPSTPPLKILGEGAVTIEGMEFVWSGPRSTNPSAITHLAEIAEAEATLRNSAFIGSPAGGVLVHRGATLDMRSCLVAGNWDRGIEIGSKAGGPANTVRILECEFRSNQRSHIVVRHDTAATVIERNLLRQSAWFGIRPGATNMLITGNAIFDNARSALYSVGSTAVVTNNLFAFNHYGGISCWNNDRPLIANNTFIAEPASRGLGVAAMQCIGSAHPTIRDNIFAGFDIAVHAGANASNAVVAEPVLGRNLFWRNGTNFVKAAPASEVKGGQIVTPVALTREQSPALAPGFVDEANRIFSLRADSPARAAGLGAADVIPLSSQHPLRDAERRILPPPGNGWGFQKWRKPPTPDVGAFQERLVAIYEKKMAASLRPDVSYAEAFTDLHAEFGRNYQSFKAKGIDWDAVSAELTTRAEKVANDREFGLLCQELVARLEDSHAFVGKGLIDPPVINSPRWDPGFACLIDDRGRPAVYHIDNNGPAERAGMKPGMVVLSLNGVPAEDAIAATMRESSRYNGFSSDRLLRYHAARGFVRQAKQGINVKIAVESPNGDKQTFNLPATQPIRYLPRRPVPTAGIRDSANVDWTRLDDETGLIYVRRIRADLIAQLDKAVAELRDVKGLIIDVRGNSGGGFDFQREHRNFSADRNAEPDRPRYTGPVALLIDSRCISAGEGWASWFIANKRARVFGTTTAGASSRKKTYELKNKLFRVTYPVKPYRGYLDRPIERRGLEPDVAIRQNAADLAAGKDTVLEAAKAWLKRGGKAD